jgi:branched-chain amino acid aminotransferase
MGSGMIEVFPIGLTDQIYMDIIVLKDIRKARINEPFYKSLSSAFYIKAGNLLNLYQKDECVLLNDIDHAVEGLYSNIFILKDSQWLTPPVNDGCISGVFRQFLLDTDPSIKESIITLEDINEAEEIFLTNAIKGIQLIRSIDGKKISTEEGNKKALIQKPW